MNLQALLFVFIGGGLGASLRFSLDQSSLFSNSYNSILFSNLLGCFLMGAFLGFLSSQMLASNSIWTSFLAVGFLGGLTTFSTYALHLFKQVESANWIKLTSYFLVSNIFGFLFLFLSYKAVLYLTASKA